MIFLSKVRCWLWAQSHGLVSLRHELLTTGIFPKSIRVCWRALALWSLGIGCREGGVVSSDVNTSRCSWERAFQVPLFLYLWTLCPFHRYTEIGSSLRRLLWFACYISTVLVVKMKIGSFIRGVLDIHLSLPPSDPQSERLGVTNTALARGGLS